MSLDSDTLAANLRTIEHVDRPVVVYLSANDFVDSGVLFSSALASNPANLMWTRSGPLAPQDYFNNPFVAWSIDDSAPVNVFRRAAFSAAIKAICGLSALARRRIVAVSVLGETSQVFSDFSAGPSFDINPFNATDYSPTAVSGFHQWLSSKYRSISLLNAYLGSAFKSFGDIYPPSKDIRTEVLSNYFQHIDPYATGIVPVLGWIHDRLNRDLSVTVLIDGRFLGNAELGLSRTDVTDANPAMADPNVGFRYNLDYRNLAYGIHTLDVRVQANGQPPLELAKRDVVIVDRSEDPSVQIPYRGITADPMSVDSNLSGYLDEPAELQSLFFNPLAKLWIEYRNVVIRNYLEGFARIADRSCIGRSRVFSHQVTPSLYGSWNGDLLAVDESKLPNAFYNQGTTLYGGAAFGSAFILMKQRLGWGEYGVNELHPIVRLMANQYATMFEMHRMNGAVFVSPYYMSILPSRLEAGSDLDRYRIAPDNTRDGSDAFWRAIRAVMQD